MADYNIPDVMLHRVIPSMFNPGDFPVQWVGDNPTLDERRQYIHTYLEWRLPHDDMEKQERELRDLAERKAAMKLINGNVAEVGARQFEWLVDEVSGIHGVSDLALIFRIASNLLSLPSWVPRQYSSIPMAMPCGKG